MDRQFALVEADAHHLEIGIRVLGNELEPLSPSLDGRAVTSNWLLTEPPPDSRLAGVLARLLSMSRTLACCRSLS